MGLGRPTNFSWIDENVAGSGRPSSLRELRWLKTQGIEAVLTVAENPIPNGWIHSSGINYSHLKWFNHEPATPDLLEKSLRFIQDSLSSGRKLVVHCGAGSGRTGTILAAYLVRVKGFTIDDAIQYVRKKRPGSIERTQEEYLRKHFGTG